MEDGSEFNSGASRVSLPILNEAGVPMVSPSNTYNGLTTRGEQGEVALPVDQIVFKEIQFTGSLSMQSFRYPSMLSMVERGRLEPKKLITETIPLEKAFAESR